MTPLIVEFNVAATPEHAFAMWTARTELWWPRSHTVTKARDLDIVFEGRPGGRIFERAVDGREHDWGRVTEWDPPYRLAYQWHLFFDPAEATDVEVTFAPGDAGTDVRIEQRGWERLGAAGVQRRTNTNRAWGAIVPEYVAAVGTPDREG
ncbi:MAG: SRPBCC domain-containing protein [Acidimicrobiia bacterium]|nr:SRPBCC domain-containing protein [Acidimicrobiia bacterium]